MLLIYLWIFNFLTYYTYCLIGSFNFLHNEVKLLGCCVYNYVILRYTTPAYSCKDHIVRWLDTLHSIMSTSYLALVFSMYIVQAWSKSVVIPCRMWMNVDSICSTLSAHLHIMHTAWSVEGSASLSFQSNAFVIRRVDWISAMIICITWGEAVIISITCLLMEVIKVDSFPLFRISRFS